jgi:hypothetical protein
LNLHQQVGAADNGETRLAIEQLPVPKELAQDHIKCQKDIAGPAER